MEPLEWAQFIVACDHVSIRHIVTEAEGRLVTLLLLTVKLENLLAPR